MLDVENTKLNEERVTGLGNVQFNRETGKEKLQGRPD